MTPEEIKEATAKIALSILAHVHYAVNPPEAMGTENEVGVAMLFFSPAKIEGGATTVSTDLTADELIRLLKVVTATIERTAASGSEKLQ